MSRRCQVSATAQLTHCTRSPQLRQAFLEYDRQSIRNNIRIGCLLGAVLMPLGLCYQTTLATDPATAAKYASKAVLILMAMTDPAVNAVDSASKTRKASSTATSLVRAAC